MTLLCSLVLVAARPELAQHIPERERRVHDSRLLVQPRPGVSAQSLGEFHAFQRVRVLRTFTGLRGLQILEVPAGESLEAALRTYRDSGLFQFAEPDYVVRLATTVPDDPKFLDGTLWGLNNFGQNGGLAAADIDAPEAWDIRHSASNVVVAITDSGVRQSHHDLSANLWRHPTTGSHGFNALSPAEQPDDDNGHGTLVAGILGAVGNNGLGVVGVCWSVQIMACKFVDRFGEGTLSDAIACIDFARTNGAKVINASWGIEEFSEALSNVVHQADTEGIIVVAAAGNRSTDTDVYPYYPASLALDNVVAVAATTRTDELHFQSNYGLNSVHLGAPGSEIVSTYHLSDDAYATRFGTSMATPFVAGAMALLCAEFPAASPVQLIQKLLNGTDPLPGLQGKSISGGRLNLQKALSDGAAQTFLTIQLAPEQDWLELQVRGQPGRRFVVESSIDFREWLPVATNQIPSGGFFAVTNSVCENCPTFFYRAVETLADGGTRSE